MRVSELMSRDVATVGVAGSCREAVSRMVTRKIRHLPVVDGGRVVGIITETDLLRRICRAGAPGSECAEIVVSFP